MLEEGERSAPLRPLSFHAALTVRIQFPPARSLKTFGSAAWERSRTPTRLLHRPPLRARSTLRSPTRPDRRDRLPEACGRTSANLSASWWPKDQFELIEVLEEEREDLRLSDFRKSRSRFLPPCHAPDAGGAAEGRLSPAAKARDLKGRLRCRGCGVREATPSWLVFSLAGLSCCQAEADASERRGSQPKRGIQPRQSTTPMRKGVACAHCGCWR